VRFCQLDGSMVWRRCGEGWDDAEEGMLLVRVSSAWLLGLAEILLLRGVYACGMRYQAHDGVENINVLSN